jgi:CrcB protein
MLQSLPIKVLTSSYARSLVAVAMGGLVGSAARSGIGMMVPATEGEFPTGVVIVNLLGSFLLGLYLARRERAVSGPWSTRFWAIGVFGSFTTFSALSVDLVDLLAAGRVLVPVSYLSVSVVGGLALALFGRRIGALVR